jgi:ankyrin repeat protein
MPHGQPYLAPPLSAFALEASCQTFTHLPLGMTPASIEAVTSGDTERLKQVLADDSAAGSARDGDGVSVLMLALYRRRFDMAEMILATEPPLDVFELAALGRVPALAARLATDGAAATSRSADGYTPLHLAAFFAQAEAARVLLDNGADPGAVAGNDSRVQPLHSAMAAQSEPVASLLLAAGADPDARQQGGWTALHAASLRGDLPLVQRLLDHGARPDVANDDGLTPVEVALRNGHLAVADLLG